MSKARAVVTREILDTVERLATEDQERILRIANLLTQVPTSVQRETQQRLRSLVDCNPRSLLDFVSGIDEVIDYLETWLFAAQEPIAPDRFLCSAASRRRS
jgi:hypothetical protein